MKTCLNVAVLNWNRTYCFICFFVSTIINEGAYLTFEPKPEEISKELQFSEVYHSLIHSPALETLLNLEHTYALTIEDLILQRDSDLKYLDDRFVGVKVLDKIGVFFSA